MNLASVYITTIHVHREKCLLSCAGSASNIVFQKTKYSGRLGDDYILFVKIILIHVILSHTLNKWVNEKVYVLVKTYKCSEDMCNR